MAKVNQKLVKEKLDEWAEIAGKIQKLDASKQKQLDPFITKHNEELKPILEKFETKKAPLQEKLNALESEICTLIEADRDADGNPNPVTISTEKATAVVEKKIGSRVVDVKKYFDFVKTKTADFWNSMKVTIKDAEKIVGKNKIDDLSEKKTTFVSSVRLKD